MHLTLSFSNLGGGREGEGEEEEGEGEGKEEEGEGEEEEGKEVKEEGEKGGGYIDLWLYSLCKDLLSLDNAVVMKIYTCTVMRISAVLLCPLFLSFLFSYSIFLFLLS